MGSNNFRLAEHKPTLFVGLKWSSNESIMWQMVPRNGVITIELLRKDLCKFHAFSSLHKESPFWQKLLNEGCCQRASPHQENNTSVLGRHRKGCFTPQLSCKWRLPHPAGSPSAGGSPSPFQQFPLPSWPASCGIPFCGRCWSGPMDPACLSLCLCLQQSAAHSSLRASDHLEHLRGHLGASPLPASCQAARSIQETSPEPSSRQCTNSAGIAWGQATRDPDDACILGADLAWLSLSSSKKNSEAKGKPYHLLPELVQFPHIEGLKYSFAFCPFHSNILRHNLERFL